MPESDRSPRGAIVQGAVLVVAIVALWLFIVNGGASEVGRIWAQVIGAR